MLNVKSFNENSLDFSLKLLEEKGVAVIPGSIFGTSSEGWIRITFAVSGKTIVEGIKRIGNFLSANN